MSINQYHYPSDFSETHLWSQYMIQQSLPKTIDSSLHPTYTSFIPNPIEDDQELLNMTHHNYNTNNIYHGNEEKIPKVPLFEKPLTPSDVGKLNRLVIPKQHAERYFPSNGAESAAVYEKGFLLSFEDDDDVAKSWRFRYSYWNSSQSYVLTKGWSRFVKEKKLEAGDVVLFFRHRADAARLFIGWRRRSSSGEGNSQPAAGGGAGGGSKVLQSSSSGYPYPNHHHHHHHQSLSSIQNQTHYLDSGSVVLNQTIAPTGNCRRLRLFGVNLECQLADESDPSTPNDSPMSSQGEAYQHQYHQYYYNHTDINFSGGEDVYRQG